MEHRIRRDSRFISISGSVDEESGDGTRARAMLLRLARAVVCSFISVVCLVDSSSRFPRSSLRRCRCWSLQEFSGGYCFLWVNSSKDIHFHKELELELKNLQIADKEPGTKVSSSRRQLQWQQGGALSRGNAGNKCSVRCACVNLFALVVFLASLRSQKYVVDLKPGAQEFMILKEVEPKQAYGVSMRAGFSLQKIKA